MLAEIILFLLLGIFAGILTGLIPGLHINLLGAILVSLSVSILYKIDSVFLVVFITSMSITHTFIDFIPSIFLGCPDTDTELSTLPGHDMLKEGKGYEAILLSAYGSLAGIFIILLISYPAIISIPNFYNVIEKAIPYILIAISFFMIFSEKKKFNASLVFALSGALGLITLNLTADSDKMLLPLLSGLFGSSMLLISIKNKTKIPKQFITKPKTKLAKPVIGALLTSPLCSFLPGLGSGQAAIIGNTISRTDKKGFMILLGATNTIVMGFSFISFYIISKTRTGSAAAIKEITGSITIEMIILILFVIFLSGIISFFITILITRFFTKRIHKINYAKLSLITIIFLVILVSVFSGLTGLIIFIVSTLTGIYCISLNVRRTNMMGCLILPTILFYLFGL